MRRKKNKKNMPVFWLVLFNFVLISLISLYIIYLRFVPYTTINYSGYAISGKQITTNLMNTTFEVDQNIKALKVNEQDEIYEKLENFYLGENKKENINLDYPIYLNDSLALYNLSSDVTLITDNFQEVEGYSGCTLTSGALYNIDTLKRADYYNYILMKTSDNLYINAKDIKINTYNKSYNIPLNSIINFTDKFITYYTLKDGNFVYNKILDIDDNSQVIFEDYQEQVSYNEFLIGLNIKEAPKEEIQQEPVEELEPNEKKIKKKIKRLVPNIQIHQIIEEKIPKEIKIIEVKDSDEEEKVEEPEEPEEAPEEPEEEPQEEIEREPGEATSGNAAEAVWVKPTVECENFEANVYSATSNITITDPSRVIYKNVTFSFYKGSNLAFRTSASSSGFFRATKLSPNTTYKVIGSFQYIDKEGDIIENTCLEQEFTTGSAESLNPIELSIKNGKIYYNKIEIDDLHIASNIEDEPIYGVKSADITINDVSYVLDSNSLKELLSGNSIKYQSAPGLQSNTKCKYEIKFYDTDGNEMKLENNTGETLTSKQTPSVKLKVSNQEVVQVDVDLQATNKDNVILNNFNYVLYSSIGKVIKNEKLKFENQQITFSDLDPQDTYTLKLYADYDIEDGNGMLEQQEIGNATFSTLSLSKLGSVKMNIDYNEDEDLTYKSIKLITEIDTVKTDVRLLKVLKNINFKIEKEDGNVVYDKTFDDINDLMIEPGKEILIDNLDSYTNYNIIITSVAKQGSVEENINVSYTLRNFKTNKIPAKMTVSNVIVTTNLIDMDVYIDDKDGACLEGTVVIRMIDDLDKECVPDIEPNTITTNTKVPTNRSVRLTYTGLKKDKPYKFTCDVNSYNDTNNEKKIQNNFQIYNSEFTTSGLGGEIDLTGLDRKVNENSKNLIDINSQNNWYSQCFDAITTNYSLTAEQKAEFTINSKYNYEKKITNNNTLSLLSNQCYVYNFKDYVGQEVTISFEAKSTEENVKVYIQKGKDIGKSIEEIEDVSNTEFKKITKKVTIPEDGYLGFFLDEKKEYVEKKDKEEKNDEDNEEDEEKEEKVVDYRLEIKNLQVELGNEATDYKPFEYKLSSNVKINFIDKEHVTYDNTQNACKYYVRIISTNSKDIEYSYEYDLDTLIEAEYQYEITENTKETNYEIQLIIKQYGREYVLDKVEFEYIPKKCTEIKSISTVEEYKDIQPYGNYIILNDLNFNNSKSKGEFTFGNPNISFYGSIDFNGKTISKDTYSISRKEESFSYMFYNLEDTAKLKNIVIDFYINNPSKRDTLNVDGIDCEYQEKDGLYSLFLYNEAKIDNVVITLKECVKKEKVNIGLMGYKNSGIIDNFIIKYETTLYGSKNLAGVCLYSDGTLQNGYIYGNGIEAIGDIAISDYRNIGGVLFELDGNGLLQNVYNISSVIINHLDSTFSYGVNIVYNVGYPNIIVEQTGKEQPGETSTAKVSNVYSVQPITTEFNDETYYYFLNSDNKVLNQGPNIYRSFTSTKVNGSRYFCDVTYNEDPNNVKTPATSLYEAGVQDVILNTGGYNQFIIDKFVNNGYYPHLNLNYCMPEQDNIVIDIKGIEVIDVLSGSIIENNDINKIEMTDKCRQEVQAYLDENNIDLNDENVHLAEFRIYNPAGTTITEINMNYLDSQIMSQTYSKKVSTVYVVLNNPTSFLDEYDVASIKSVRANGRELISIYGKDEELGRRTIEARFIKYIKTAEDWQNINIEDENQVSGLIQNYRLAIDINFEETTFSPYITGNFTGYLDGMDNEKIHTISNINGDKPLIQSIDGATVQNLNIDKLIIESDQKYIGGLVTSITPTENFLIDNIHIKDLEITSNFGGSEPFIGGICAYISSGSDNEVSNMTIQNCGITNFDMSYSKKSATITRGGGIVGYWYAYGGVNSYIQNCFVQDFNFQQEATSTKGIGGIVGYKSYYIDENVKPGKPHFYITNCYTTGKINVQNYAGGILGYGYGSYLDINKCYSLISLTSNLTSGAVYLGGIVGYLESTEDYINYNLYTGNIYVAGNNVSNFNRIVGNKPNTYKYNNYAYKDQLMSGEVSTNLMGAKELLSFEKIFTEDTFKKSLNFDDNFAYDIVDSNGQNMNLITSKYFPQLKDTRGNLQINQKLNTIDNDLKLSTISSNANSNQTEVTVTMKFENPNNLDLYDVEIENDDMRVKENSWKITKLDGGFTQVEFVAIPNKAFESYKIESIYYKRDGQELKKDISTKIKVVLYHSINSAKEWNTFFDANGSGSKFKGQNVKITGDIDFENEDHIASRVTIGRLDADSEKTISNITIEDLTANSGFINEIKTNLKNIKFKNVKLKGKGSYIGIIGILRGSSDNVKFENIDIDCSGYDYIASISRCISGNLNKINLNKVKVRGKSYVAGLCSQTTSLGKSTNLIGEYLNITGTDTYVGGIFGYCQGTITTIEAYQYSKDGKKDGDDDTDYLVKGVSQVGGCIGRNASGGAVVSQLKTTNSTILGTSYVGANAGYTSGCTNSLTSNNNVIKGTNYVGGNIGGNYSNNSNTFNSEDNEIEGVNYVGGNFGATNVSPTKFIAVDNSVTGTGDNVGGSIGHATNSGYIPSDIKVSGSKTKIIGKNYVGGAIGQSASRIRNIKVEDVTISGTGQQVGGIVGRNTYNSQSVAANNITYYSIAGAYAKKLKIKGAGNYVGGVVGYELGTIYATVAESCSITSNGSYAGGIAGYYSGYNGTTGSQISSTSYFLWHSYCTNSTIQANNYAGGLVGHFIYGNIQYCYVAKTSVNAKNNGAGGLVGYFDNSKLTNLQYKAYIKYNYIVNCGNDSTFETDNVVSANNCVGGVIGCLNKKLNYDEEKDVYNNIECNLIVTDLKTTNGNCINMGAGAIGTSANAKAQCLYMNNIYVYDCSYINNNQVGGMAESKSFYELISSSDLSKQAIFKKNDKVYDEEEVVIGNKGLNFGKDRYNYSDGYFPLLKTSYTGATSYWEANNLNVNQDQIPIPTRTENFSSINNLNLQNTVLKLKIPKTNKLPNINVYPVDVDKINIEFEGIDNNTYFEVTSEKEQMLDKQSINDRVYSFTYDYSTPFTIKIYNNDYSDELHFEPKEFRNLLDIASDEYFYLIDNKLYSNKREISTEFLNIYKGKGLGTDGYIYDLATLQTLNQNEIHNSLLEEKIPIRESEYQDTKIKTYYHCSKIIKNNEEAYKDQQIFVKNGEIYLIDGDFENIGNAVILDSYNNKKYEATLGMDGNIYNLFTNINYPKDFKNKNIIAMTNNFDNDSNIVLVYYSSGRVIGFNYVTGEEVFDNGIKDPKVSLGDYIVDNFEFKDLSYEIDDGDYLTAQKLAEKLDKVSINDALNEINSEKQEKNLDTIIEDIADGINSGNDNSSNTQTESKTITDETYGSAEDSSYITTFDSKNNDYVVYSTEELFSVNTPNLKSENEKINNNDDLIDYYGNISNGKEEIKSVGGIAIIITVFSICIILVVMYKKIVYKKL